EVGIGILYGSAEVGIGILYGSAEVGIGILYGSAEVGIGILYGSAEVGIGILFAPGRPCIDDGCVERLRRGRNRDSICRSRTLRVRAAPLAFADGSAEVGIGIQSPRIAALDADATSAQEH
ncbi:MAG: hypothetical protein M3Q18_11795, partial [Actinomycetota bacterium]|nr:hypothetical protein [Actinomycetota bacterium]